MARMGEKRRHQRIRRKLKVVLSHDPSRRASTTDIALTGIAIASDYVAAPGTEIHGEIVLPDARAVFRACVRWARKSRGRAILVGTNAMGLEFVTPPGPSYQQYIESIVGRSAPTAPRPAPDRQAPSRPERQAPSRSERQAASRSGRPPRAVSSATATRPAPSPNLAQGPESSAVQSGSSATYSTRWVGQSARHSAVVGSSDLAPPTENPAGIALVRFIQWMEEATQGCLAPLLPPNVGSAVVGSSITVSHVPPVEAGATVTTVATIAQVADQGRTLRFEVRIGEGNRPLANGIIARSLVEASSRRK